MLYYQEMTKCKQVSDSIGWDPDTHSAERQMQLVVEALNGHLIKTRSKAKPRWKRRRLPPSEMQIELRRLVESWRLSGPNVRKLFVQEPKLADFSKKGQIFFYPTDTGRGYLDWSPSAVVEGISPPEDVAGDRFMRLITNPNWETLGGPCLACGDYFVKKTDRSRLYCSKKCGSKTTAVAAVKTKRELDHLNRIRAARVLIEKWEKRRLKTDWKDWVSRDPQFGVRWLTRMVNQGKLTPPSRPYEPTLANQSPG